jgi:hypothetical protein
MLLVYQGLITDSCDVFSDFGGAAHVR